MNKWKRANLLIVLLLVFSTLGFSQGVWKHSGTVEFPMPVEDICLFSHTDRTIQALIRNGEVLEHWTRGSRSPFPWIKQAVIPGKYKGSGTILLYADGNYLIGWSDTDGVLQTWWSKPSEWPDPSHPTPPPPPPPPIDKKLSVSGNKFYYGDDEIRLAGCSRLEALWRALKIRGFDEGWGNEYSQTAYEQDLIDSGMNFVRHLGVKDTQFLYDHCKRMKDAGIIVSIGVYRVDENEGVLVNLEDMGDLAKLGNVFFDACNEFIGSNESEIATVIDISENLRSQGCLVSAGAWSGDNGKRLSRIFHTQYSGHDIESHHREWEEDSFRETLAYGKPVVFDEFFSQGNKTLQEIKDIFKTSVDLGIATNYYGYRFRGLPHLSTTDPFDKDAIPDYAGELIHQ